MADINQLPPQPNLPEPTRPHKVSSTPDSQSFQEALKKIEKTDTEQQGKQKKKKGAPEEEDEGAAILSKEPDAPTGFFSLDGKKGGLLDVQSTGSSPLRNAAPPPETPPSGNIFSPSATPLDQNVKEQNTSSLPPPPIAPSARPLPTPPQIDTPELPDTTIFIEPTPLPTQEPETLNFPPSSLNNAETPENTTPTPQDNDTSSPTSSQNPEPLKEEAALKIKPPTLDLHPTFPNTPIEKDDPSPPLAKPTDHKDRSSSILRAVEGVKKKDPLHGSFHKDPLQEEKELSELLALPPEPHPTDPQTTAPPPLNPTPYASLSPQILALFEKMVGVITVMHMTDRTETTLMLNSPQYANSKFFGTKITILADKNAPGSFNIKLEGTPESTSIFSAASKDLMAAFQYGNYNFRVQRLDISLLQEERKDIVHRKEGAAEDHPGQS